MPTGVEHMAILNIVPLTANKRLRAHWIHAHREREVFFYTILSRMGRGPWIGVDRARPPKGVVPAARKVTITVGRPARRLQDPDNLVASLKGVIDSLRRAGWIWDDSGEWLRLEAREVKASRPGWTEIKLEEMPCESETRSVGHSSPGKKRV